MHIRSPKSGYLRVHITGPAVKEGEVMFSLDSREEEIEVMKAELAVSLVRASIEKIQAGKNEDRLNRTLDAYRDRSSKNAEAHEVLLASRRDQAAVGEVGSVTVLQAVALLSAARRDLEIAKLGHDNMLLSLDNLTQILPMQQRYSEMAAEIAKANVARMVIRAPVTGGLTAWQASDGWTRRGAIVASFDV